jgi:hypothetical protein
MPERVFLFSLKFIKRTGEKKWETIGSHYSHCYGTWNSTLHEYGVDIDYSNSDPYFMEKLSLEGFFPFIAKLKLADGKLLFGRADMVTSDVIKIAIKTKQNITVPFHIPIVCNSQNRKGTIEYLIKHPEHKGESPFIYRVEIKMSNDVATAWLERAKDYCEQ